MQNSTLTNLLIRFDTSQDAIRASSYRQWRQLFALKRLRIALILLAFGNLGFYAMDFFLHPDQATYLLISRLKISSGVLFFSALTWIPKAEQVAPWFLAFMGLSINYLLANSFVFDVYATVSMFDIFAVSSYYLTLTVAVLVVALIVPVYPIVHIATQAIIIGFYAWRHWKTGIFPGEQEALFSDAFHSIWIWLTADTLIFLQSATLKSDFESRKNLVATNAKLSDANAKANEIEQLKTDFFSNISHELRTPLTLIIGVLQSISKQTSHENIRKSVRSGLRNTSRLLLMINDLLDLAKMDSGTFEIHKRPLDLISLANKVVANFENGTGNRLITVESDLEALPISGDSRKLKTVIFNLVANAVKYTDDDKGRIILRISKFGDSASLSVIDNGVGIQNKDLDQIFDRFSQGQDVDGKQRQGTGIGLAMVAETIKAHQGTINVDSKIGAGTTFHILLPAGKLKSSYVSDGQDEEDSILDDLYRDSVLTEPVGESGDPKFEAALIQQQLQIAGKHPLHGSVHQDSPLIVIAEDNPELRTYIYRLLSAYFRVVSTKDGAEALSKIEELTPDLIITDMMMPVMTGSELLDKVRNHSNNDIARTPVIFLTAQGSIDARIDTLAAGASDYLGKPFQEQELIARVRNLLKFRSQEKELSQLNVLLEDKIEKQMKELANSGELEQFLPSEIARRLTKGDLNINDGFSRERVTALFADLVGYTDLMVRLEPEESALILNEYLDEMTNIVVAHQGIVDKFVGDAVMGVFGPPKLLQPVDHATKAAACAIAMQAGVQKLTDSWRSRGIAANTDLRVGLYTGYVTIGFFGGRHRKSYTAVGTPVNIASRLQANTMPGSIVCGDSTQMLISASYGTESIGEVELKGISHPIPGFLVTKIQKHTEG